MNVFVTIEEALEQTSLTRQQILDLIQRGLARTEKANPRGLTGRRGILVSLVDLKRHETQSLNE